MLLAAFQWAGWALLQLVGALVLLLSLTICRRLYLLELARCWRKPIDWRDAILVTGATSGIGLALAKHLYKRGYTVFVGYLDRREPGHLELEELRERLEGAGAPQRLLFVELDVRDQQSIARAHLSCAEALEREPQLRLAGLVNNAGLGSLQPFAWLPRPTIEQLVATNLLGALQTTREFLPLLARSSGRVLNVSSGLALVPGATYATYGLTKCALLYFTQCLNLELEQRYGVRAVAMIPHNFIKHTNICRRTLEDTQRAREQLTELERALYADELDEQLALARQLQRATDENKGVAEAGRQVGGLRWLARVVRGENVAASLEQSGCLECFEDALRLARPPELMFAGDKLFTLLVGSLLLSVPPSCAGLLSSSLAPSLYR